MFAHYQAEYVTNVTKITLYCKNQYSNQLNNQNVHPLACIVYLCHHLTSVSVFQHLAENTKGRGWGVVWCVVWLRCVL